MKSVLTCFLLLFTVSTTFAQTVFHARVDKTDVLLRGAPVVLAQITMTAPAAGKVALRFDGDCISSVGDRIVLAASRTVNWGGGDNSLYVKAISNDLNSNVFSHTRVYDVAAGENTFYAVAENYSETGGNGKASVYGSLTAEWFPEAPGQAFVRHKGISEANFNVEGAPVILAEQSINVTTPGKVVVRFDGLCISSDGDLIMLAASDTPGWSSYDGSSSVEIADDEFNKNSFAHVRTYEVTPGNHTYYAVIENYYEIYGNGIASVLGSLTVAFYPNAAPVVPAHTNITQFGAQLDAGPVVLGEVAVAAPVAGKVVLNFTGTCIGSFGDYLKLAASDIPDWGPHDGNLGFEPFSSDRNRTSFSHTRVYDVPAGEHHFYGIGENVQEFFGSGLAVVYGSLNATFYPGESVAATEPEVLSQFVISPNPASGFVNISTTGLDHTSLAITLLDQTGRTLRTFQQEVDAASDQLYLDVSGLPAGAYFIRLSHGAGSIVKSLMLH